MKMAARSALECGGLTPPFGLIGYQGGVKPPRFGLMGCQGGVKPPHSKALRAWLYASRVGYLGQPRQIGRGLGRLKACTERSECARRYEAKMPG